MKNLAIVENGIVTNVLLADDDFIIENAIEYTDANPAYIGGIYDGQYFYYLQPYPSWTADKGVWIPPIQYPNDGQKYVWNEATLSWDVLDENTPE